MRFAKFPLELASRTDVTPASKIVYAIIVDKIGGNARCWSGLRSLATATGLHRDTVSRCVHELAERGLLIVEFRGGMSGKRSERTNVYKLPTLNVLETQTLNVLGSPTLNVLGSPTLATSEKHQRPRNPDVNVLKTRTFNVDKMSTEPDPVNQTQKPETKGAREKSDWEAVSRIVANGILDTEKFRDAWKEWAQHRREIGKPLKPTMVGKQMRKLKQMGCNRAIAAIEHSVTNGWTGIYEDKENGKSASGKHVATTWEERHQGEFAGDPGEAAQL